MDEPTFPGTLKDLRESRGITQNDLAEACKGVARERRGETGLHGSRISEMESGRTEFLTFEDVELIIEGLARQARTVGAAPLTGDEEKRLLFAFVAEHTRTLVNGAAAVSGARKWQKGAGAVEAELKERIKRQVERVPALLNARDLLERQRNDSGLVAVYSGIGGRSEISGNPACARLFLETAAVGNRPYVLIAQNVEPHWDLRALAQALQEALPAADRGAARRERMLDNVRLINADVSVLPDFAGHTTIIEEGVTGPVRALVRLRLAGSMDGPVFATREVTPKYKRLLEAYKMLLAKGGRTLRQVVDQDIPAPVAIDRPRLVDRRKRPSSGVNR